jgi:hypothetical protein
MLDKALDRKKPVNKVAKSNLRKHVRVKPLTSLEQLKTAVWVAEIERIASNYKGHQVLLTEIIKTFTFEDEAGAKFSGTKLRNIKEGLSPPGQETVEKIEKGYDLRNLGIRPFVGTKALIDRGPDGFPLWKILEGDSEVCMQVVDEEVARLLGKKPDDSSSFEQRVKALFMHRLPSDIDKQVVWEMIFEDRTKEFHYDFNVFALTARDVDAIPGHCAHVAVNKNSWRRAESVVTLSAGQVVANIALYVLSRQKKELIPHCHYMLVGVLQKAVQEQLSYGELVAKYLSLEEWAYQGLG